MVPGSNRRCSNASNASSTQLYNVYTDEIVDTTFDYDTTHDTFENQDNNDHNKKDKQTMTVNKEELQAENNILEVNPDAANEIDSSRDDARHEDNVNNSRNGNSQEFDTFTSNDDDGEDNDDTEESESEDEEDNEPPKLKYTRLSKLPSRFFSKDPVSCCLFHEKIFITASHSGLIHLAQPDFSPIRTLKAHRTSILSLHTDGEYFISGSIDGTVVIGSILDDKDIIAFDFKRPIHAVALDKQYKTSKSFVSGGMSGKVIYSTRNWLGQRQDTVLDSDNGPITMIKTIEDLIIWTNDTGISVGQISARVKIHQEPIPKDFPRPDLYWPKVHYSDADRIVIGWVNHVWFFRASVTVDSSPTHVSKLLSSASSSFKTPIDRKIEVENHIILEDNLIAGISEFNDDLMILNYIEPKCIEESNSTETRQRAMDFEAQNPELKIIDRTSLEEISVDVVGLNSHSGLGLNDYHLYQCTSPTSDHATRWFLVSANDAVIVQEFNLLDQLTWYNAKGRYLEAWSMSEFWLDRLERLNIGIRQIEAYVAQDLWKEAGEFLGKALQVGEGEYTDDYLQKVTDNWNMWIGRFKDAKKWDEIVDVIPSDPICDHECLIDGTHYDELLEYYLGKDDFNKVIYLVNKWNHMIFDVSDVKSRINDELKSYDQDKDFTNYDNRDKQEDKSALFTELRHLYVDLCIESDEPELCIEHMILLDDSNIMQFLDEHHLITQFLSKLPSIISVIIDHRDINELSVEELKQKLNVCILILVENSHEVLPQTIIDVMDECELYYVSYLYLEELSKVDKLLVRDFEDEMVKLYASFNKSALLSFLTKHANYSIENAIEICEKESCISELVYLLSKVGRNKKALTLIVDDLKDPERAISFVNSFRDKDLWDFLLDYSMDKPDFIRAVMVASGDLIDPVPVVSRIPNHVEINGLKNALLNITANIELDHTIYEMILNIISNETMLLTKRYRDLISQGYTFDAKPHERIQNDTLIKFAKENKELLITEAELLGGVGTIWKGTALTHTEKITHLSFIKRQLLMIKLNLTGPVGTK